ncbi:hypothetical protein [Cupriavidus necator]|uniref:hypothetical protein n=1 Tax=Cupriavidus necator TaxID=106590 RepID=UPI00278667BD|nr:hypothetical protein [Cupriavidus necator]MDQ0140673.1 hypothetical protein [Cupriavidus necator]
MYLVSNDMTATLPARSSLRLVAGPGEQVAVRCTAGELWLIRDGDPKDTALTPSECLTLSDTGMRSPPPPCMSRAASPRALRMARGGTGYGAGWPHAAMAMAAQAVKRRSLRSPPCKASALQAGRPWRRRTGLSHGG